VPSFAHAALDGLEGGIILRSISVAVGTMSVAALLVAGVGHGAARAASTNGERLTSYIAPTGPEMTPEQVQSIAVLAARRAGETGAIHLTQVQSNFAHAHVVLMGGKPSEAAADESGPAERAEEMRSGVWVSMMTATDGSSFSPNVPTPRGHTGPSGQVMVIVTDAHTGFIKERYLGPQAPDLSLLGPELNTTIPAEVDTARAVTMLNPKLGSIQGRLSPARVGQLVTLRDAHGRVVHTTRSVATSTETRAGSFGFRALEGHYVISAPHCGRLSLHIRGLHVSAVTLHCSA
jgi:hypothetical protein